MDAIREYVPYLFACKTGQPIRPDLHLFIAIPVAGNYGTASVVVENNTATSVILHVNLSNTDTDVSNVALASGETQRLVLKHLHLSVDSTITDSAAYPLALERSGELRINPRGTDALEITVKVTDPTNGLVHSLTLQEKHLYLLDNSEVADDAVVMENAPYVYLRRIQTVEDSTASDRKVVNSFHPRTLIFSRATIINPSAADGHATILKSMSSIGNCEGACVLGPAVHSNVLLLSPAKINGHGSMFYDGALGDGGFSMTIITTLQGNTAAALSTVDLLRKGNALVQEIEQAGDVAPAAKNKDKKEIKVTTRSADTFTNNLFFD